MTKTIVEGDDPFAEAPSLKKRVIKGLAITVAALVMITGGLVWFRFQPAFNQGAPSAIAVIQPAWGTASAIVPPPAPAVAAPVPAPADSGTAVTARNAKGTDAKAGDKPQAKPKAQAANARRQSSKELPPQVAKTP